jgi:hypothetical protein
MEEGKSLVQEAEELRAKTIKEKKVEAIAGCLARIQDLEKRIVIEKEKITYIENDKDCNPYLDDYCDKNSNW